MLMGALLVNYVDQPRWPRFDPPRGCVAWHIVLAVKTQDIRLNGRLNCGFPPIVIWFDSRAKAQVCIPVMSGLFDANC